MAGLTKIINDVHAVDIATTPYKGLINKLSKAGKDAFPADSVFLRKNE